MIQSRKGKRFTGCSNYPDCKTIYPLPQLGKIVPANESCDACGAPIIKVWQPQSRTPWILCVNMDCPKRDKKEKKKPAKKAA